MSTIVNDTGSLLMLLYLCVLRQSFIKAERVTHLQNHTLDKLVFFTHHQNVLKFLHITGKVNKIITLVKSRRWIFNGYLSWTVQGTRYVRTEDKHRSFPVVATLLIFRGNDVTCTIHASRHLHESEVYNESKEMCSVRGTLSKGVFNSQGR